MLTQDDLKAIGTLIRTEISPLEGKIDTLTGRVDMLTDRVDTLSGRVDTLTGRVDTLTDRVGSLEVTTCVRFDAVQESLNSIENRMVTKSYLDDKLAHYVPRPF